MNTLKHLPARPDLVRSRPASKNSDVCRLFPTPSTLLEVRHGVVIVPVLTVAQAASSPAVFLQSTPWATGLAPSEPVAPPFHLYTVIVETAPPLVNAETMSRSPSLWLPVNGTAPLV